MYSDGDIPAAAPKLGVLIKYIKRKVSSSW